MKYRYLFALPSLLWLAAIGCTPSAAPTAAAPPPTKLLVAPVVRKQIVEWDEYIGRFQPTQSVEVQARVTGYLESIHFVEGDLIKKGDLLFVIDPRPFEAALKVAEAAVQQAKAQFKAAEAGVVEAKAQTSQVEAADALAQLQVRRATRLISENAISREDYDTRQSEAQQARANLEASQAAILSSQAAVATAQAAVESALANVETAKLDLQYTRITAPISGRISRRYVTVGNLISGSTGGAATVLTNIVSLSPIHCYFDADEQAYLKYDRLARSGQRPSSREAKNPVYAALQDEKGFPHRGHMDFVDNSLDQSTGTIRSRAIFANDDLLLTPGMFARIRIPGSGTYDAILIPDSAIGFDQSDQYVYVQGQDNKLVRRSVTVGPLSAGLRVIRSGLQSEDRVVVGNLQKIMPGMNFEFEGTAIALSDKEDELPNDVTPVPREQWLSVDSAETNSVLTSR